MEGIVLPAHPLCLDEHRHFDEDNQRLLTEYYIASGAGGVAVGVHSTQFEIRDPQHNLFEKVLEVTANVIAEKKLERPFLKIAGICGPIEQAIEEAKIAVSYGYDMGLLSMGGLHNATEEEILERTEAVAQVIPVFGFYLQPSVGGRVFSYDFWTKFVEIKNVEAIKCASFNRYQTLDVVRAIAYSSRKEDIALYTGNDDNIINDLLAVYRFDVNGKQEEVQFKGGLLGHWAVWTRKAVELIREVKSFKEKPTIEKWRELQILANQTTDANAIIFDVANDFKGCIPGIHEVLRRQGLMKGIWCLNPEEILSLGQFDELNRIERDYPWLNDNDFVTEFLLERR
ncbi:dihydrodipicolinate synthase family protein [Sphingobacterium sp. UT-1RO-CII-1]|uniref:dihydrodipicolinate synthase family protein n=1 Tax=Sphingobacterium sp. UT-1RO-CII-1 TaxID=2995225 RepID=UPI00227BA184|nr:dihydrodipicolinate synthase family protein [Sphingobacterium sp. UT-1RO-CII-1]MCY4779611.1 dihydrodipicolinate synthase family protein [Sphingobacterium sp. UT-1RO-CII-1]